MMDKGEVLQIGVDGSSLELQVKLNAEFGGHGAIVNCMAVSPGSYPPPLCSLLAPRFVQVISPQANKPVMGIIQDMLCGIRKFILQDTSFNWTQVQKSFFGSQTGTAMSPHLLSSNPNHSGQENKS